MASNLNTWRHHIFFSTDLNQSWQEVLAFHKARFQIEFLYRDAKQYTGLNDCQARGKNKLNFHQNMSLTVVNLAKVVHWLPKKLANPDVDVPFSMRDIKTRYDNRLMVNRFICKFAINPKLAINQLRIAECLEFYKRAG